MPMASRNLRSPDCSRPENAAVVNAAMATPATSAAQAMARRFRLTAMPAASGRPGTAGDRGAGQVIMVVAASPRPPLLKRKTSCRR